MARKDTEKAQRRRERKEAKKREKDAKASHALTEQGRSALEIVLDGGKGSQPSVNIPKAMKDFNDALELKADNADAFYFRGRCHNEAGDREKAIEDFKECLTVQSTHVAALMQLAMCYEHTGRVDDAIEQYNLVIDIDPRHDAAYNLRGSARLARRGGLGLKLRYEDFAKVESDFLAAVRCNENNYYALCNLGRLYDEHGMFEKAMEFYTNSMEVKDDYFYAAYRRGCCALTAIEESLRKLERSSEKDPTAVVLDKSRESVPFYCNAPRDASRIDTPKTVSTSIFTLPPISKAKGASVAQQQSSSSAAAGGLLSGAASGSKATSGSNNKMNVQETELEREAKSLIEQDMTREKEREQLSGWLKQAISDFTRLLHRFEEVEDKLKELPTYLHRASCYLYEGELEKADEDIKFMDKHFGTYSEIQPSPTTSPKSLRMGLDLVKERFKKAKHLQSTGHVVSPFVQVSAASSSSAKSSK